MESLLQGITHVTVYIDDILIIYVYLGYVIDAEKLHPLPDKVQAVQQAWKKCDRIEILPRVAYLQRASP